MKILLIDACIREGSRTRRLAEHLLKRLNREYETLKLQESGVSALNEERLEARTRLLEEGEFDDPSLALAGQFREAELIVIAAPYYDLSFPALLKDYLETINCVGLTFGYDEKGMPVSLSTVKKVIFVTTSGGMIVAHEYGYGYVRILFESFYGVEDFAYFHAEGLDIIGNDPEAILQECEKQIDEWIDEKRMA